MVHAEMAALSDAARRGLAIGGCTLYNTTFPCHMCARHLIASGIRRVVYIEPYTKSIAKDLYDDSMEQDTASGSEDPNRVHFRPFVGVAPRRYLDFFRWGRRKTAEGKALKWARRDAAPRIRSMSIAYIAKEAEVTVFVNDIFQKAGYGSIAGAENEEQAAQSRASSGKGKKGNK